MIYVLVKILFGLFGFITSAIFLDRAWKFGNQLLHDPKVNPVLQKIITTLGISTPANSFFGRIIKYEAAVLFPVYPITGWAYAWDLLGYFGIKQ